MSSGRARGALRERFGVPPFFGGVVKEDSGKMVERLEPAPSPLQSLQKRFPEPSAHS